jgi:hypothetical protein
MSTLITAKPRLSPSKKINIDQARIRISPPKKIDIDQARNGQCGQLLGEVQAVAAYLSDLMTEAASRLAGKCQCDTCRFDRRDEVPGAVATAHDLRGARWGLEHLLSTLGSEFVPVSQQDYLIQITPVAGS